jgi:hydroxyacylglutathione hydrolase
VAAGDVHAIADEALANTSYLIEIGGAEAAVVDPRRDIEDYLSLADRLGLRITASLETHLHADFVSGSRELTAGTGAEVIAPVDARLGFEHRPVRDGAAFTLGELKFEVLGTPGHTPEHVAYLMREPHGAVFSGGSLIAGGAARTDLIGPERTRELAWAQFESLKRIAGLEGRTTLHPTHGAGSFCSTGRGVRSGATVGDEIRSNPLLAIEGRDEFVDALLAGYGSYPPYFLHLREVNRRPPGLADLPPVRSMSATEAAELVERGAWLIDGRPVDAWAGQHPTRAVSIAVRPDFVSWLGWVVPFAEPVVLLVEPDQVEEALRFAHRIGYDRIAGWVDGGIEGWRAAGLPTSSAVVVTARDAMHRTEAGERMLDVRQDSEWERSRIPGAVHLELGDVIAGKRPAGDAFVVYCGQGERSTTAVSLLARDGVRVTNLAGGIGAWKRAGLPIER